MALNGNYVLLVSVQENLAVMPGGSWLGEAKVGTILHALHGAKRVIQQRQAPLNRKRVPPLIEVSRYQDEFR